MPELAGREVFRRGILVAGDERPVGLRDDAERGVERPESGYPRNGRDARCPSFHPAVGMDAQPVHRVRADLNRPVGEGDVHPVLRRAKRAPVGAHVRSGGGGEGVRLTRADARQDEATAEIVAFQRPRGVRRGDGREVLPRVGDGRGVADETALWRLNPALEALLLVVRDRSGRIERLEAAAGADHHLDVVRAAVAAAIASAVAAAVARLDAGEHPHGDEERAEDDAPGLRLLLEERHEVSHGADVILVHKRDKPRDGRRTREGEEKSCPESRDHGVTSSGCRGNTN